MNNEINKEYQLTEIKSNKTKNENELNKNNDISTTKEEESFITDEVIQYCSSPRRGLVSINISNSINDNLVQIPTDNIRITNTVTMRIAMLKKEIDLKDSGMVIKRKCTYSVEENENNNNNKNKDIKCKSNFKEKKHDIHLRNSEKMKNFTNFPLTDINRIKLSSMNIDTNENRTPVKKKISKKTKKKKFKKSLEKNDENKNKEKEEEKSEEKRRLSLGLENENKKKKKKKKKNKKKKKK